MNYDKVGELSGKIYSELWKEYKGDLFDQYTYDLWYKWNRYDLWLDAEIKGKVCLDAGFGSGRAMAAMLGAGAAKVFGIDISPNNFHTAQQNLSSFGERIDLRIGSVLEMPFEDETFDLVHCYGVLHHTSNPYKGFQECCRVVKKGGILFIAQYCKGGFVNNMLNIARFFTTRGVPPFDIMKRISQLVFGQDENHFWYALLDGLYTPIREMNTEDELRGWYARNGVESPVRYYSTWSYYKWHPLLSGNDRGLIILKGKKK